MSLWSTLGKVGKFALPIAGGALFGPLGGLAGGAIGGLVSGGGAKGALTGGLGGLAGGAALKGAGLGGIASKLGKGGLGSLFGGGGQQSGTLGKLGGIAQLGLAGLDTAQGAQQQAKAEQLRQQILTQTNAQQGDRDLARKKLMGQLGNVPQRPNLGSLFAGSSNPFSRPGI